MPAAAISHERRQDEDDRKLAQVFSAYIFSATLWLLFATAVGLLVSFKFAYPDFATAPGVVVRTAASDPHQRNILCLGEPGAVGLALYVAARSSGARLYSVRARLGQSGAD